MPKTLDEKLSKKLDKIREKWMESEELSAESLRRHQVAQEKFYGWLIEWVQSQRVKIKEKRRVALLSGILQRIIYLRNHVLMECLSHMQSGKFELLLTEEQESKLEPVVMKMVELYTNIRRDLAKLLNDDTLLKTLPFVSRNIFDLDFKLKELDMCLGQLAGYVFGKMMEFTS